MFEFLMRRCLAALVIPSLLFGTGASVWAAEFSVSPIRAELKAGILSETITVTNHDAKRLRVSIKLMEWTQDAAGNDVYKESSDLIYFPRQMDVEPNGQRLVRVGAKGPGGLTERTYRLFIEEEPDRTQGNGSQVAFYFRFGVPIMVSPALPKPAAEVEAPTMAAGKVFILIRNTGNQYVRVNRIEVSNGSDFKTEAAGWYSLAGTQKVYSVNIPPEVCRKANSLAVTVEGEGLRFERTLEVDPAACG